jgi:hypothetical protein
MTLFANAENNPLPRLLLRTFGSRPPRAFLSGLLNTSFKERRRHFITSPRFNEFLSSEAAFCVIHNFYNRQPS